MTATRPTRPARVLPAMIGLAAAAAVIGALAVRHRLPHALDLPLPALVAVLLLLVAVPVLLRRWMLALVCLLAWLMVEDLVRKLAGNDLRVYFVKDLFYLVVLVALVLAPGVRGAWRSATGWARLPFYAFVVWALVLSVPTALHDVRTPLVGLRVDFLYVPLVVAGYLAARHERRLATLLLSACVLGGAASVLGIAQAVIGPIFLSPGRATPGLMNLVLIRDNKTVYRPTGTFVDPGRFDAMAVTTLAVSLAAIFALRGPRRLVAVAVAMAAGAAIWVSGGRTGVLEAAAIAAVWLLLVLRSSGRIGPLIVGAAVLTLIAGVLAAAAYQPRLFLTRLSWYASSLDPRSATNEWSVRWNYYAGSLRTALRVGGWTGLGTGHESLGRQYVFGGAQYSQAGLFTVEGGYASVMVEWGLIGLGLWLAWTLGWVYEQWWRLRRAVDRRLGAAGWVLFSWVLITLFFGFYPGFQGFQNYTTNCYLWLLSGVMFGLPHRSAVAVREVERSANLPTLWVMTPELRRDGGTEYCVAEQLDRWRDRYRIRLYTMRVTDFDLTGIELRRIPRLPGPLLTRYLWWFAGNGLARWLDAGRLGAPDAVYSPGVNGLGASVIGVHMVFAKHWDRIRIELAGARRGARHLHRTLYWALIRRLERFVYRGAALLWSISNIDAREIERRFGRPAGSVPVVPHGVDSTRFSPAERRARRAAARARLAAGGNQVCLLVGNDAYKKGVDIAVQALAGLDQNVVLAVAGRMDPEEVRKWARAAGVEGRVRLWPHTREVADYYAAADVLVAPSREDSFHMPALEALACGLPVVLSTEAGAAELVDDGRNALLLRNPGDSAELSDVIRRVLEDPGLARRLARAGRALAERCSWAANADQAAALIDREACTPRALVLATDPWGVGGIQRVTRALAGGLSELYGPERVGMVSVWDHPGDRVPCRELYAGAKMPAGGGPARVEPYERLRYVLAALSSARRWRHPRLVVIACHSHLAPVAMAAAWVADRPFAVWCHGKESWGRLPFLVGVALRRANVVFAPTAFSAAQVEAAAHLPPGSVRVVPHGLDVAISKRRPARRRQPSVLSVARLDPDDAYKGVDSLLCAWPQVIARVPKALLTIVGEGADRPRLQKIAQTLALDGTVRFVGRVSDTDLTRAYAEADVFALVGRYSGGRSPKGEGFGLVFIEAGAAGVPVVAGRGAGTEEAVRDGETGLLVEPDDPRAVAAAIVKLLGDRRLARRMGARGREHAQLFSLPTFTRSVEALVQSLLTPASPHQPPPARRGEDN
jgi:phosphatidyl-myo-inositol dimannoside synthase